MEAVDLRLEEGAEMLPMRVASGARPGGDAGQPAGQAPCRPAKSESSRVVSGGAWGIDVGGRRHGEVDKVHEAGGVRRRDDRVLGGCQRQPTIGGGVGNRSLRTRRKTRITEGNTQSVASRDVAISSTNRGFGSEVVHELGLPSIPLCCPECGELLESGVCCGLAF